MIQPNHQPQTPTAAPSNTKPPSIPPEGGSYSKAAKRSRTPLPRPKVRMTTYGHNYYLWIAQSYLTELTEITDNFLRVSRCRAAKNDAAPWQYKNSNGEFYYRWDTIPDRAPTHYRSKFPDRLALREMAESPYTDAELEERAKQRLIKEQAKHFTNRDIDYLMEEATIRLGYDKAESVAQAAAYCRLFHATVFNADNYLNHIQFGLDSKEHALRVAASLVKELELTSLKTRTAMTLRHKLKDFPILASYQKQLEYLIDKKHGNQNRRIVGTAQVIDEETGELMPLDAHQAAILALYMNIGHANKEFKTALYENKYKAMMEAMDLKPVSYRTFCAQTDEAYNKVFTARERHGAKAFNNLYKTYCPALPLEYANSLWVADGSGIKLKFQDKGKMRTLYAVRVQDAATRCILGFCITISGTKDATEKPEHVLAALKMALETSGGIVPMDWLSDNGSAFTAPEAKQRLNRALPKVRTITPGQSQQNYAEIMVRQFTEMGRDQHNWGGTGYGSKTIEHEANFDEMAISRLPYFDEAYTQAVAMFARWNATKGADGFSPTERYTANRREQETKITPRQWRYAFGHVTEIDLLNYRGFVLVEHKGVKHHFTIADWESTMQDISASLGYLGHLKVEIRWRENEAADIYNPTTGAYITTATATAKTHKSEAEATDETFAAMGNLAARKRAMENEADAVRTKAMQTLQVMDTGNVEIMKYDEHTASSKKSVKKDDFNEMMENVQPPPTPPKEGSKRTPPKKLTLAEMMQAAEDEL